MTKVKPTQEVSKDGLRHLKNGSVHKKKQQKFKNTPTGKVALIGNQNGNQKHQNSPSQSKSPKGSNKHSNSPKNLNSSKSPKIKVEEEEEDDDDSSVDDINEGISINEEISAPEDEVDDDSSSSETEAVPDIFGTSLAEETDEDDDEFDADSDEDEGDDDAAENKGVKMFKGLQAKIEPKESTDDDEDDDDDEDEEDDDDDDSSSSDEDVEPSPGLTALLGDSIADESDDEDFKGDEDSKEDEDSDDEVDQSVNSSNAASTTDEDDDDDEESSDDDDEAGPDLTALLGNSIAEDSNDEDFEGAESDEDDEDEDISDDDDEDDVPSPKKKAKAESTEEEDDDEDDDKNESFDSTNHKSDIDDSGKPVKMTAEEKADRDLRTIFIGNVPKETEKSRIKNMFKKFGSIDSIRIRGVIPENPKMPLKVATIKKKFHSKSTTICIFVTFNTVESAQKALSMNGKKLDGNFLRVDLANQSINKPEDKKRTVFLGNLPFAIEDNEIWEAFKECGKIESVRIIRDRKSGVGRGFGYINFETQDGAVLAMDMNGTTIRNRELRVKVNTPEGKKKQREEKKGKKRQLAENAQQTGSPKKLKAEVSETAQVAKHNSVNAERRKDKKKRSQGEKQRVKSESTSPEGKGKFQGQKADNKKRSKPNKHAKKKMQMAAKLLSKPKKPSPN